VFRPERAPRASGAYPCTAGGPICREPAGWVNPRRENKKGGSLRIPGAHPGHDSHTPLLSRADSAAPYRPLDPSGAMGLKDRL
jgi:hypothetical protein